jgi:AGCS family alanine or glycine:cation symporter
VESAFFTFMTHAIGQFIIDAANLIWGAPILILLLGGGFFFLVYSRLAPLRYIGHALKILTGKYDNPDEPGQLKHYQALSTALAGTIGMGNISGVAVAIATGGPGAMFWMWISALLGVSTKFFECSLAVMFRGKDSNGEIQGGPMYFITEGLGKKWKPVAVFFAVAGMIGVSPMFQANQLTQILKEVLVIPNVSVVPDSINLYIGIMLAAIVGIVIFGGVKRIGNVTGRVVPIMVILYSVTVIFIILSHVDQIIPSLKLIFVDAFTGKSVMGGAVGAVIITGVRRASFSNEAGLGTASMAHGAAKTSEPIREGMIAMLGPIIDTMIVCTMTALVLIITGVWNNPSVDGVTMTTLAFESTIPVFGKYILLVCVLFFSLSTMFAYPYYGVKCLSFITSAKYGKYYNYFFAGSIVLAATTQLGVVISLIDLAFALMAFPTVVSSLLLAPHVKRAATNYFRRLKRGDFE